MGKVFKTLIRVGISVSLISYLLYTQDFEKIRLGVLSYNPIFIIFALILLLSGTLVSSLRWQAILSTSKVHVKVIDLFKLYIKGYFYNNFLPTQMGGDVYKSVSLGNIIKDQATALFSVFMDRFSGLIVLLIIGLFGISSMYGVVGVLAATAILVIGLALYFPVLNLFSKKIKFLNKFKRASDLFVKDKKNGSMVILYSFLVQMISFATSYVLFMGMGITLPLWGVFAYMPIASLSLLIPSFNGFGTQETVYAFLFNGVGVTSEVSITVSLMMHVVRLTVSLIGGALLL
ncbi:hypothetical protein CO058_02665 [candidate division WWE3 bacterium CG_4_9_14_0_2_um_filter_35_11]|uniref:Flippase-like domain-containing protein n=1 Tax=candidate division WWE3 bacterium CG_4_9_14_0_2_um_filter_35_11 TaxID=1975077 RepID=A0A2M8ELR9_UNCKA|nr:MAG: hypothetical protein COV25_02925 [candidate division WWE3 bacterium CG10_big_fil_rev_8_21_14_0_10_35_32]PJC23637.1 MAG: hypothetical protein CO058_02665 [candidate division WWE3 bacterium CG_4_9_14_0_2_um_filter_35_11]